jgi:hypothetical protein
MLERFKANVSGIDKLYRLAINIKKEVTKKSEDQKLPKGGIVLGIVKDATEHADLYVQAAQLARASAQIRSLVADQRKDEQEVREADKTVRAYEKELDLAYQLQKGVRQCVEQIKILIPQYFDDYLSQDDENNSDSDGTTDNVNNEIQRRLHEAMLTLSKLQDMQKEILSRREALFEARMANNLNLRVQDALEQNTRVRRIYVRNDEREFQIKMDTKNEINKRHEKIKEDNNSDNSIKRENRVV